MIIKMIGMMMSVRKKMEAGGVLCAASSVSPTRDDASCPARKPVTVKKDQPQGAQIILDDRLNNGSIMR